MYSIPREKGGGAHPPARTHEISHFLHRTNPNFSRVRAPRRSLNSSTSRDFHPNYTRTTEEKRKKKKPLAAPIIRCRMQKALDRTEEEKELKKGNIQPSRHARPREAGKRMTRAREKRPAGARARCTETDREKGAIRSGISRGEPDCPAILSAYCLRDRFVISTRFLSLSLSLRRHRTPERPCVGVSLCLCVIGVVVCSWESHRVRNNN